MDAIIMKLSEARDKDLILIYLRKALGIPINVNTIRQNLMPQIPHNKMRQYYEELRKEEFILDTKWNPMDVVYQTKSDVFIALGGYVKRVFEEEKIEFNKVDLSEAHHKDLILCRLKSLKPNEVWNPTVIVEEMFPNLDVDIIRRYVDLLRFDEYIVGLPTDDYLVKYYEKADKFIDEGGYTGKYLFGLLEERENEKRRLSLLLKETKERKEKAQKKKPKFELSHKIGLAALIVAIIVLLFGNNIWGRLTGKFKIGIKDDKTILIEQKQEILLFTLELPYLENVPIIDKGIFIKYYFTQFILGGVNIDTVKINARSKTGESLSMSKSNNEIRMDIYKEPFVEFEYKGTNYSLEISGKLNSLYSFNCIFRKNIKPTMILKKYSEL